jgi:hypothetical protein
VAILYRCDGTQETLTPPNGVHWTMDELRTLVGGHVECRRARGGHWLAVDEEAKLKFKKPNLAATELYIHGEFDMIVGDAVWTESLVEMLGPPEEK